MRMIRPRLEAPQLTIAEEQGEYKPITAALVRHPDYAVPRDRNLNTLVLAFRPDDEERARLVAGEDVYISLLTFMRPMQPILVSVGPEEPAAWYGVEVEK